jgi:hypothetical protein
MSQLFALISHLTVNITAWSDPVSSRFIRSGPVRRPERERCRCRDRRTRDGQLCVPRNVVHGSGRARTCGLGPRRLTAVVGRLASGVSKLLSNVVSAAGSNGDGPLPVLAWGTAATERPARELDPGRIITPEITSWNVDELRPCRELVDAPEGVFDRGSARQPGVQIDGLGRVKMDTGRLRTRGHIDVGHRPEVPFEDGADVA